MHYRIAKIRCLHTSQDFGREMEHRMANWGRRELPSARGWIFGYVATAWYQSPGRPASSARLHTSEGGSGCFDSGGKDNGLLLGHGVVPNVYQHYRWQRLLIVSGQTLWDARLVGSDDLESGQAVKSIHTKGIVYNGLDNRNLLLSTSSEKQPIDG